MPKIMCKGVEYSFSTTITSYEQLTNKPTINNVALTVNKTPSQLGLLTLSDLANKVTGTGLLFAINDGVVSLTV